LLLGPQKQPSWACGCRGGKEGEEVTPKPKEAKGMAEDPEIAEVRRPGRMQSRVGRGNRFWA
jgi:hypothetical protein